jgi:hypothetical protein
MFIERTPWLKEFERNPSEIRNAWILFWSCLILGFGGLCWHGLSTALVWWIFTIFHLVNYFWARKTPLLRITHDEMMIFSSMLRAPSFIRLDQVSAVEQPNPRMVLIVHAEQKKERVLLFMVRKNECMEFVEGLRDAVSTYHRQHPTRA